MDRIESDSALDALEERTAVGESLPIVSGDSAEGVDVTTSSSDPDKAVKKQRRNRWGAAPVAEATSSIVATAEEAPVTTLVAYGDAEADVDAEAKKGRRSRWSSADVTVVPTLAAIAPLTQEVVQQTMVMKVQLEQIGQRLITVAQDAARISLDPSRSPSPPPRYDGSGKRSNTRDVRMKEELMEQRGKIIEELMKINPTFQPPSDFVRTKPFKRLMIPFREFPTYNFIGLIIGPRGNTQKELEQATGCKISIRGKGSSKEGSKGRAGKNPDDDEELHVHVTADDAAKVEEAAKLIAAFLNPIDDEKNDHKQKQLRELALINGTLKEEEYCPVCGEKGHRQFECPHRAKTFKAAGVKCSICGDLSHPTRDCPLKKDEPTNAIVLDSEYDSFMAELDGGGGGGRAASNSSSSAKSDVSVKVPSDVEQAPISTNPYGGAVSSAPHGGTSTSSYGGSGPTMLGTVDLSGILSTPSSSGYGGAVPTPAPKRQQTIIVVTTVLTGYVAPSTGYMAPGTSVAPAVSYATSTSSLPPLPLPLGAMNAPWAVPSLPPPPVSYSYAGYNNNPNPSYYPPPMTPGYYQQPPNPWGTPSLPPPPPPVESAPLPPPPGAAPLPSPSPSPWMTTAEQQHQKQGQQGVPYNYTNGR